MSQTKQLLLCASCSKELAKVRDGSLSQLHTGELVSLNNNIDVLITGVGLFQTIYNLTYTLRYNSYKMIIAAGIAGDYNLERQLCNTYVINRSTFADIGFEDYYGNFAPIAGSIFLDSNEYPFNDGYILNNMSQRLSTKLKLPTATANTVCRTCTDSEYVRKMLIQFPADLETMESAAFGYVCAKQHIGFAEIRSTSNHVAPKKQEKWQLDGALSVLGTHINTMLEYFCI
ncbi:MAG: hypothetical protein K6F33_11105 [Bacteroidales bacterium]|nr:hypothetical protein [Bacteroidales bacterium]